MVDHSKMRLGKQAVKQDHRTLMLAHYLTAALPAPPVKVDWTKGLADWGMMLNDQLGCCTIAAIGHAIQVWTMNSIGRELTLSEQIILGYYEKWDGYKPSDPASDQGGVEIDVLKAWRRDTFDDVTLDAFAAVHVANTVMVQQAINLFGGIYLGVELPLTAQQQDVWAIGPSDALNGNAKPGSWGDHAVYVAAYDAFGPTCITWGAPKKMSWPWFEKYCSEAYALISKDWLEDTGVSPGGFDLATLEKDLAAVAA